MSLTSAVPRPPVVLGDYALRQRQHLRPPYPERTPAAGNPAAPSNPTPRLREAIQFKPSRFTSATLATRSSSRTGFGPPLWVTNLQLQKKLYVANMLLRGEHKTRLVHGHFEAWNYGPVHPALLSQS